MHQITNVMTDELREKFRIRLIEQEATVTAKRKESIDLANCNYEKTPDQCEEASRIEDRNYHIAMADKQLVILRDIKLALKNFDTDFGYCYDCGDEIDIRRLEINPAYRRCTSCEQDYTLRHKNG